MEIVVFRLTDVSKKIVKQQNRLASFKKLSRMFPLYFECMFIVYTNERDMKTINVITAFEVF